MNKAELSGVCRQMRRDIINMTANAGSGHPGGSLSAVELVASVFHNHMRIDPQNPHWADRDRFVLSKGHAAPCYYAVLAELGFISRDEFKNFRQLHSILLPAVEPFLLAGCAAPIFEKIAQLRGEQPFFTPYSIAVLRSNGHFSNAKAVGALGFHARPLRETLRSMILWFQEQNLIPPAR